MKEQLLNKLNDLIFEEFKIENFNVILQVPKDSNKGDYTSPLSMSLAKKVNKSALEIAKIIKKKLKIKKLSKVEIVAPGFLNFFINESSIFETINKILRERENYGKSPNEKSYINIEFISVNPTGWLHIGHARNAAYGSSLVNIMRFAGHRIDAEYYINDAGSQMQNLALSIIERYKELCGFESNFDNKDLYKGYDVVECAKSLYKIKKNGLIENINDDKIQNEILEFGYQFMLDNIKNDLEKFNINIDVWYSERKLFKEGLVKKTVEKLDNLGVIYEQDGAKFLKTTAIKDDKDRVLYKSNGEATYFAPDIAYHEIKKQSGVKSLINVWGADHDGYVDRIKSAMILLGYEPGTLEIELMQLVKIERSGQEIKMSKRMGTSITIKEIIDEIGSDALRYFLVSRTQNSNMVIDLDKVIETNSDNPLFYVQYAHARCNQLLEKSNLKLATKFTKLKNNIEGDIVKFISTFNDVVESAALNREPHKITNFVHEVASKFHAYYNANKIISSDEILTSERLSLVASIKQVILNSLKLIGVSAPNKM